MDELTNKSAEELLLEWSKDNHGRWVERSIRVAKAAEIIAKALNINSSKAYILGLMYDIGRVKGNTGVRHTIDGYNFLKEKGYSKIASICITHAFITKEITNTIGEYDLTNYEFNFLKQYLENVEYDIYVRLIQFCDTIAMNLGYVIAERRMIDLYLRYGINDYTVDNIKGILEIQAEIEDKLGYSVYKLFPEVKQNIDNNYIKDIISI